MKIYNITEETIQKLKKLAGEVAWDDDEDFCVDDYAAGNEDDAFYGGQRSGEINLARDILKEISVVNYE